MRAFLGLCLFVAGGLNTYFWEFIRAALYDRGLHMLSPHGAAEIVANYGLTAALIGTGVFLYWPSRPEVLRFRPSHLFLERDSVSDLLGVQTFPGVSYIQLSVKTSASVEKCRAWLTKAEFSPDEIVPYALEHNERIPLNWSKHGGAHPQEADLHSGDSPVRINVLVFDNKTNTNLGVDAGTPTNWIPLLQRIGFHRLTIQVTGKGKFSRVSDSIRIIVNWHGAGAWTKLDTTK